MNGDSGFDHHPEATKLELAFEYLVAKDTLKWISITSEQVKKALVYILCIGFKSAKYISDLNKQYCALYS